MFLGLGLLGQSILTFTLLTYGTSLGEHYLKGLFNLGQEMFI